MPKGLQSESTSPQFSKCFTISENACLCVDETHRQRGKREQLKNPQGQPEAATMALRRQMGKVLISDHIETWYGWHDLGGGLHGYHGDGNRLAEYIALLAQNSTIIPPWNKS